MSFRWDRYLVTSDIIKKLLDADTDGPATAQKNLLVEKLVTDEAGQAIDASVVPKLVSMVPFSQEEKQQGPVTVVIQTPYKARDTKGLLKALKTIDKTVGKIGRVLFEGSFEIGRNLSRFAKHYDIIVCVRDHPLHLGAFKHLGGSGRSKDPMQEVRERLDDDDRLLRRGEAEALEDMLDMASGTVQLVLMPGSSRMALAEQVAASRDLTPILVPHDTRIGYADDIEPPPPPATLLVVTQEDYSDVAALVLVRTHLATLGRKVMKIIHTPSLAMEVLTGLDDGMLFSEIDVEAALADPLTLMRDADPDYIVVAGNTALGAAVANMAARQRPKVPCVELA